MLRRHPQARKPFQRWENLTIASRFENFAEVKAMFPSADMVGACVVFNLGGNKYRLIAKINYEFEVVTIKHLLTHPEYDKDSWKSDC
ncbi:MAG: type II toxin-antitoxin system HigB family toxin [Blastocatellia bacterium]